MVPSRWVALVLACATAGPAAGQVVPEPVPVGRAGANQFFAHPVVPPPVEARASAQAPDEPPAALPVTLPPAPVADVAPTGCSMCGRTLFDGGPATGLLTSSCPNCSADGCYPGRDACHPCTAASPVGRLLCGVYECLCCPDPCYEPKWTPVADAAFFTAAARPVTHTRFRGSFLRRFGTPDRAEWYWARADGRGRGPRPVGPAPGVRRVDADQLSMYTEAAAGKVGVFTETSYRTVRPDLAVGGSGFSDLFVGTKTLLFDCELLQVSFQFATYIPIGNPFKGLGTGHVSLEPSLILGLKLAPDTFLQTQIAEWIPLGGDPTYQGSALHYHFSLNHVLCRPLPDVPVITVFEMSGITFQDGAFTDPFRGSGIPASGSTYFTLGPGVRVAVCDRIDFGYGSAYAVGNRFAPQQEHRIEFRVRY